MPIVSAFKWPGTLGNASDNKESSFLGLVAVIKAEIVVCLVYGKLEIDYEHFFSRT